MKQGFWHKIKEVSWKDFPHVFLFLLALPISFFYKRIRKDMWLICENKNEACDNAYWLFKYIREQAPQQDVVYAICPKAKDFNKVEKLGQVISFGTLKHWIYYLTAVKNISTQKNGKPNAALCYLLEVYGIRNNVKIFLQHGITINDVSFLYYKNSKISMFVCGTKQEYDFIKERFGYPENSVRLLGLCRFDQLHDQRPGDKKQIVIMPTWRGWISPPSNRKAEWEDPIGFQGTEYYKRWNSLLNNGKLREVLEQNDIYLVFYLHREMQVFTKYFISQNKRILIGDDNKYDVQTLLKESLFLITDYSSISMDFAYMKKPLLYYQFDFERFREQHYSKGYFSYENDGFGPVCHSEEEVVNVLCQSISKQFQYEPKYMERHQKFFSLYDTDNCKRNYEAIKNL